MFTKILNKPNEQNIECYVVILSQGDAITKESCNEKLRLLMGMKYGG